MTENRLSVSIWFGQRVVALPSETYITPHHFQERHIADRCARLGFEDVRQMEQIIVRKVQDRAVVACNRFGSA
jgi:hypothetical protein